MQDFTGLRLINNGKFSSNTYDIALKDGKAVLMPSAAPFSGKYCSKGFVDIHTHGALGHDISECTQAALDAVSRYHLEHGVTHFCPTFVATPLDELDEKLNKLYSLDQNYAHVLPAHLEGPYISVEHKGAQPEENILRKFSTKDASFFKKHKDHVAIVTLCPGVAGAATLVDCLTSNGIKAQAGHDNSTFPDIEICMQKGLDCITHYMCGCSAATRDKDFRKEPALVEAGLFFKSLKLELIADGIHISENMFRFISSLREYKDIMLVSDSLSAAGMKEGKYKLAKHDIVTDGKAAYLADLSSLAGSVTSVADMVRILIGYGVSLQNSVMMASDNQRAYLGDIINKNGKLCADINVIDEKGNVLHTFL